MSVNTLQHRSPPHIHSPKSPHCTTPPSLQNPPTTHALQSHSPPHVSFPMSPPYTTPPPQNPPKALRKQDAIVYESSTDPKVTVEKFFGGLKNYKHNKLLEDLVISGMTVKEFWQCGDKYYMEFECGKLLVPKHVHLKLSWIMQKIHELYYLACVYGLNFIKSKILGDIFNTSYFDLHVELAELHTIIHLKMLDVTIMHVWCM
jgi:hypothetical protein